MYTVIAHLVNTVFLIYLFIADQSRCSASNSLESDDIEPLKECTFCYQMRCNFIEKGRKNRMEDISGSTWKAYAFPPSSIVHFVIFFLTIVGVITGAAYCNMQ